MKLARVILRSMAVLLIVKELCTSRAEAAETSHDWNFLLSPLVGVDRNELRRPAGPNRVVTMRDTSPMYGLFGLAMRPHWVLSDFLFFTDVNESDVWGNLFFVNYLTDPDEAVAWNLGAGHLYHGIKTPGGDITVQMPIVKTGPMFHFHGFSVNPYLGYAWEWVDLPRSDTTEDQAVLYGLTLGWRWRMLHAGVNYYYQQMEETDESYQVLRARIIGMISSRWGLACRVDYSEHNYTDDFSVLVGPVVMF